MINALYETLMKKIERRHARVGVIGLGYVGLPLAIEFARAGFPVIGFDVDPAKVDHINAGRQYLKHIPSEAVAEIPGRGGQATADFSQLTVCDAIIICVPTPLTRQREPDMAYIVGTAEQLRRHLRAGQLVILESTTYPGTTREVLIPPLEAGGLKAGTDFFVAFSPEREDPGNPKFSTKSIPKVVGGLTPAGLKLACALYDAALAAGTVPVSSPEAAEATKLLENIFRCVNIAMVNELKVVFHRMGIDIWEVIGAAATKPFGFMPFYPGPGLGGHCIPIDPFYLTWKAREYDCATRFIELAGEINAGMPEYVVDRTLWALNEEGRALKGARVLLVGIAYKNDVDDTRESPALRLLELLERSGAAVDYHDPFIPVMPATRKYGPGGDRCSTPLDEKTLPGYDAVLIATNHSVIDFALIGRAAKLVVDTRNAMAKVAAAGGMKGKLVKA